MRHLQQRQRGCGPQEYDQQDIQPVIRSCTRNHSGFVEW